MRVNYTTLHITDYFYWWRGKVEEWMVVTSKACRRENYALHTFRLLTFCSLKFNDALYFYKRLINSSQTNKLHDP
jgi:hypothetical protein